MNIKVVQTLYEESHKRHLMPGTEAYFNEKATILLETGVLLDLFHKKIIKDCDWFGLISWKYEQKIKGQNLRKVLEKNEHVQIENCDIIAPHPNNYSCPPYDKRCISKHQLVSLHPGVEEPLILLVKRMKEVGIISRIPEEIFEDDFNIYSNYWLARTKTYISFIRDFLIPAVDIMQKDKRLNHLCCSPAAYPEFLPESFIKQTGFDYYPLAPFVAERLINIYAKYKKLKIAFIL